MNTIKIDFDNLGFYPKEITDENGDTWIIEGSCNRCGECCKSPLYSVGLNDLTGKCSKLVYEIVDGVGYYKCSNYENRPVGCVIWPRELADFTNIPNCTYKIRKKVI